MARPDSLTPLFRSLAALKGVGPQLGALLKRFFGGQDGQEPIVLDLLTHMPSAQIDRRNMVGVRAALPDMIATLEVHIDLHAAPPRGRSNAPHRVYAHDETGDIQIVFFRAAGNWIERSLPVGERRIISGRVEIFNGIKQMPHPDYIVAPDKADTLPLVESVYPVTQGLSSKQVRKLMEQALDSVPTLPEWIGQDRRDDGNWPDFATALRRVHQPKTPDEAAPAGMARARLAYDEYLAGQLALLLVRSGLVSGRGVARRLNGELTARLAAALPFDLTEGQQAAVADILADLEKPERMARLLQGDVGAGKTVVALMAMAAMAESGAQSALMAPTELLAAQHYRTIAPLCDAIGLKCALLTGKMSAAERRPLLAGLEDGGISILVGTHALFQGAVSFHNLGLTVVDEQHRFGVHQRLALSEKGRHADLLVMTATPIPRTLVLTHFGDMAVSVMRQKPAGSQPIDTAVLDIAEYDRVVARLVRRVNEGAQAFWVCPLVEESELVALVSAEDRFAALKQHLGDRVALLHGRMSAAEKQAVMERFIAGDTSVLVATTVIEVGVDVPKATIMIIEHAERFGLAQLHQLRGRVGRGADRSACLLLYKGPLSQMAEARLETIRSTEDGFVIAERDLQLRGPGELLGTRQSGVPGYTMAIPELHGPLLEQAHDAARARLAANPTLAGTDGEALRTLLYIFRKDTALPFIRAG